MFSSRRANADPIIIGVTDRGQHIAYATITAGDANVYVILHAVVAATRLGDTSTHFQDAINEWGNAHDATVTWSDDTYTIPPHSELLIPVIDGIRQQVSWYVHAPRERRARPCGDMRIAEVRAASLATLRTRVARARDDDEGHMRHNFFHDR